MTSNALIRARRELDNHLPIIETYIWTYTDVLAQLPGPKMSVLSKEMRFNFVRFKQQMIAITVEVERELLTIKSTA